MWALVLRGVLVICVAAGSSRPCRRPVFGKYQLSIVDMRILRIAFAIVLAMPVPIGLSCQDMIPFTDGKKLGARLKEH
jgi:hypothetical protein